MFKKEEKESMHTLINSFCLDFPENCQTMMDTCGKISGLLQAITPLNDDQLNVSLTGTVESVNNARKDVLSHLLRVKRDIYYRY